MRFPSRRLACLIVFALTFLLTAWPASAAKTDLTHLPAFTPDWNLQFETAVAWQRVTPLGHLLVKTASALSGIDPEQGKVLWSHGNLGHLVEEHYEEIPGTPLVALSDGQARPRVVILNSVDGALVFDSAQTGVAQILGKYVLPRNRKLLLLGFRQGKPSTTMFMFDMMTGKLLWENDDLLGQAGKLTKFLTALVQAATNNSGVVAEPMELDDKSFLMASATHLYHMDTRTGRINWQVRNAPDTQQTRFFMTDQMPGIAYVGSETSTSSSTGGEYLYTYYNAHKLEDGRPIWPKPVRLQGGLNDVIFTDHGLIASPRTTGKGKIKLIRYADGKSVWGKKGKGLKVQGGIVDHDWTDAGIVLTTGYDSAWTDSGPQYFLNILDVNTGALRFKDSHKLRGRILSTDALPGGVLFVTTSEANILDPASGELKFSKSIFSKDSLITVDTGRHLYAFSAEDGNLYRIDKNQGTLTTLSKKTVKLEEDEVPMSLEIGADQITVVSSQNIVAYSPAGKLKFHAYHPSPRRPALMRVLLRAQQIRMGMAAVAAGTMGGAFAQAASQQESDSAGKAVTTAMAEGYGTMAEDLAHLSSRYGRMAGARFKASALSTDHAFMMVALDRKSVAIARVSKKTGEIEGVIDLGRDKHPSYQVDGITDQIYYRPAANEIVGYRF